MNNRKYRLFVGIIVVFLILSIPNVIAESNATVSIKIHRIAKIDTIEAWPESPADWYYYVGVSNDGVNFEWESSSIPIKVDDDDLIVNTIHTFSDITTSNVSIAIMLCEEDGFYDTDDLADISSDIGGGKDDVSNPISPSTRTGVYTGYYNLVTGVLTGDETIIENNYYKTSGDYDGSTGSDQNDAAVWFSVSDNYNSPVAEAGPNHSNVETGEKVNFDGSQSTASSGSSITDYKWDVDGDGTWDFQTQIASYTYSEIGTYTVTLQVTDSIGNTDTDTCNVYVENKIPVAAFVFSPNDGLHPTTLDTVQFTDTSRDEDGTLTSWYWTFGDGSTSSDRNPTHKFNSGKTYSVSLKVTDNNGDQDTVTKSIQVTALSTITGSVKDKDGNPISNAKIEVFEVGKSTGIESTTTSSNGIYTISEIPSDTYDIESSKSGYDNNKMTSKKIYSGENTVNFVLTKPSTSSPTPGFDILFIFFAMILITIFFSKRKM